jgi:hypothetical protein
MTLGDLREQFQRMPIEPLEAATDANFKIERPEIKPDPDIGVELMLD